MFHLLTIVISVAVAAFMASAGIFYAGSAFTSASSKAQAMQILSNMEQIDSAWSMWQNDGNTTTAATPSPTQLITPNPSTYLSSFPPAPPIATTWTGAANPANYFISSLGFSVTTVSTPQIANSGVMLVLNASTGQNACLEIARSAGLINTSASAFTNRTFTNWYNPATSAVVATTTVPLSTGITTDEHVNALAANYRYFCAPLGTSAPATSPVFTGATVPGGSNLVGDNGKFLVFFKHQ